MLNCLMTSWFWHAWWVRERGQQRGRSWNSHQSTIYWVFTRDHLINTSAFWTTRAIHKLLCMRRSWRKYNLCVLLLKKTWNIIQPRFTIRNWSNLVTTTARSRWHSVLWFEWVRDSTCLPFWMLFRLSNIVDIKEIWPWVPKILF